MTPRSGPVVLATWAGGAEGSLAVAAALACAGSDVGSAVLLIELTDGRGPRPALIASAAARALEERLGAHLPGAAVASRGHICHLALSVEGGGGEDEVVSDRARDSITAVRSALPLARETAAVIHLPPRLVQPALEGGIEPSGALIRADLGGEDRPLAALAVRGLASTGVRVAIAKAPLAWVPARRALFGALSAGTSGGLDQAVVRRLLSTGDTGTGFLSAGSGAFRAAGPVGS